MEHVEKPSVPRSDPTEKAWTIDQWTAFLESVAEDRLYALWHLACWTGLRRGELLGLKWSDLDLEAGVLSVRRAIIEVDGKPQISTTKTKAAGQ